MKGLALVYICIVVLYRDRSWGVVVERKSEEYITSFIMFLCLLGWSNN